MENPHTVISVSRGTQIPLIADKRDHKEFFNTLNVLVMYLSILHHDTYRIHNKGFDFDPFCANIQL